MTLAYGGPLTGPPTGALRRPVRTAPYVLMGGMTNTSTSILRKLVSFDTTSVDVRNF